MKKVVLKQLTINNFRGIQNLTIDFNQKETSICGQNNTGKSTIMNAFMWLLFGKDAEDRKDFNIQRIEDGKVIEKQDVNVEGVLDINGEEVLLKRIYRDVWTKPKGQTEEVLTGHETHTFINNIGMNVNDYQKRITEIIDTDMFKIVSNPHYFANLPWQDQRNYLFALAGTVTDEDIAKDNESYKKLLQLIGDIGFDDYKRELNGKIRETKSELKTIQPRIDQTYKLMPEGRNFDKIESEIEETKKEIAKIDEVIEDVTNVINLQYDEISNLRDKINNIKSKQQDILFNANEKAKSDAYNANNNRRQWQREAEDKEKQISNLNDKVKSIEYDVRQAEEYLEELNEDIEASRKLWYNENGKEYEGETTCYTCGQKLPDNMIQEAEDKFFEAKSKKLADINKKGKFLSEKKKDTEEKISNCKKQIEELTKQIEPAESELKEFQDKLSNTEEVTTKTIEADTIPEYRELAEQIKGIEKHIEEVKGKPTTDTSEYKAQKRELTDKITNLKTKLKDRDTIKQYKSEISKLGKLAKELAQKIADLEKIETTMQSFTIEKINRNEQLINSLFKYVKFQMFKTDLQGNVSECCVPLVSGVPFYVANTAGQMNAGIDIINTLSRLNQVSAPIFIDNREGVLELIDTESQIINLVVTHDEKLTIHN